MIEFLRIVSWILVIPPTLALTYFSVEVLFGLARSPKRPMRSLPHRDLTFLIPAHNEASVIGATLTSLTSAAPFARILVVADNCSDNTAEIARHAGAIVCERSDREKLGKGYALDFGRQFLKDLHPKAVMVIDADCRVEAGSAENMILALESSRAPVQASNLFEHGAVSSSLVQVSNFAMLVKNLFRGRGLYRIGGSALLFGTGMGFSWEDFEKLDLASGDAVEDLQLSINLIGAGRSISFAEDVKISSFSASKDDTVGQRARWEHGFLSHALKFALPILRRGISSRSRPMVTLGMHLLVPPLALLIFISIVAAVLSIILTLFGTSMFPAALISCALAAAFVAIASAWIAEGHRYLSARSLALIPVYILWKIPIYVKFLTARQLGWNRTPRDVNPPDL